jgi:hypothetical protein
LLVVRQRFRADNLVPQIHKVLALDVCVIAGFNVCVIAGFNVRAAGIIQT